MKKGIQTVAKINKVQRQINTTTINNQTEQTSWAQARKTPNGVTSLFIFPWAITF